MNTLRPRSPPLRTSHALHGVLHAKGFEVRDFELDEDASSALAALLGVVGGVLRIKCRSTGEERVYSTGSGSAWLGAFLMDLARGHFAAAARHSGVPGTS